MGRFKTQTVPGSFAETMYPRWVWWFMMLCMIAMGILLLFIAIVGSAVSSKVVGTLLSAAWFSTCVVIWITVLWRPRQSADSLIASWTPEDGPSLLIHGSRRVSIAHVVSATLWAATFALLPVALEGSGPPTWLLFTLSGISALLAALVARSIRPRYLRFTPDTITSSWSGRAVTIRWDELASWAFCQGAAGLMVFRYQGKDGTTMDVEPATLDLDPYLILMTIETYRRIPATRSELNGLTPPARLTDPRIILTETDGADGFGPEPERWWR